MTAQPPSIPALPRSQTRHRVGTQGLRGSGKRGHGVGASKTATAVASDSPPGPGLRLADLTIAENRSATDPVDALPRHLALTPGLPAGQTQREQHRHGVAAPGEFSFKRLPAPSPPASPQMASLSRARALGRWVVQELAAAGPSRPCELGGICASSASHTLRGIGRTEAASSSASYLVGLPGRRISSSPIAGTLFSTRVSVYVSFGGFMGIIGSQMRKTLSSFVPRRARCHETRPIHGSTSSSHPRTCE